LDHAQVFDSENTRRPVIRAISVYSDRGWNCSFWHDVATSNCDSRERHGLGVIPHKASGALLWHLTITNTYLLDPNDNHTVGACVTFCGSLRFWSTQPWWPWFGWQKEPRRVDGG
jgi:hypothetical protein